ncbi:MAG TPA: hypothetical protein VN635_05515 [Conexibacter sp.]|nr:hypothetical protein [Conexibacter sp.]
MSATTTEVPDELLEELLEAHRDTIAMVAERSELAWQAHCDYLRRLQRVTYALLADGETAGAQRHEPY